MPSILLSPDPDTPRQNGVDSPDDPIVASVAREIHPGIVRLKRDEFVTSLSWLIPSIVAAGLAALYPQRLGFLALLAVVGIASIVRRGAAWMRARRDDPVERYQRQEREETDQTIALAAHEVRAARVTPVVTYTIVGVISLVTGIQFLVPGLRASIMQAALVKSAVVSGEWWRLVTSAYLHGSVFHWLANMSGLLSLGSLIEIYDRRSMIPLVFVASAIGGALASTLMLTIQPAPSLGASGGILGLAGYLFVVGRHSPTLPDWIRKRLRSMFAATAIFGLASFFIIDNAAHLGGTVTGMLVGLVLSPESRFVPASTHSQLIEGMTWSGAVVFAAGALFTAARLTGLV